MTVPRLIEVQAARAPRAVAATCDARRVTYRDLNRRANRLAHHLRRHGAGSGVLVGIFLERSLDLLIAVLAVMKCGGAYVPLDPTFPAERLEFMLQDAQIPIVIAHEQLLGRLAVPSRVRVVGVDRDASLIDREPQNDLGDPAASEDLAYVMYTSGSTGRPKGVQITHRSLVNVVVAFREMLKITPRDVLVAVTTLSFDIATLELLLPLIAGARVVVASREAVVDPATLMTLVANAGATTLQATPATWRMLLEAGWQSRAGLTMVCGGEALPPELAAGLLAGGGSLWNAYGPTETTIWSTVHPVRRGESPVPIGRAIANTQLHMLDSNGHPVPIGDPGELYIGGVGVAKGYLNRPDLTAERFVADPFSRVAGARLYRTGDLVRGRPDGALEYLGRLDHQVKIRGFRIELGEIESVLAQHPTIGQAIVVAREDRTGGRSLVGYVRRAGQTILGEAEYRAFLKARLPEYMIPRTFVALDAFPLTPNGKIDRARLPAPDETNTLRCGRTVREPGGSASVPRRASSVDARPIPRRGPRARAPLSFPQRQVWLHGQLAGEIPLYNEPATIHRLGPLDVEALERALAEVIRRHEAWRTTFDVIDGEPVQLIHEPSPIQLPVTDLRHLPREAREEEAIRRATEDAICPFDLRRGPLLRPLLVRLADDEHRLFLTMHHIIFDGVSIYRVFLPELTTLYAAFAAGRPSPLPELPIQYADFACWQHDWLASGIIERQLAYWRRHLARPHPVLDLPTDHPRPPMQRFAGAMERLALSATLTVQLKALSGLERATLYMTLLTAFTALLARYTGQADLVVGSVTAGRNRAEVEPLLGYFLNLLPLRLDASGDPSFRTLLRRVRDVALEGLAHDDIPFERLVEALVSARDPARNPLFDVLFSLEPPLPALPEGWKLTQLDVETGGTKLDLYLELDDRPEGIIGRFIYRTDLFEAATVRRMAEHFVRLLEAVTASPDSPLSRLPLLTEHERRQILDRRAVPGLAPATVDGTRHHVAPGDALEARLLRIWEDLLGVRPIGVTDDFFDLGGHSLLALRLLDSIRKEFQRALPVAALMQARTVRGLSAVIRLSTRSSADVLATVQPGGPGAPIFAVPGVWGGILGFVELARALGTERPVYGLQRPVGGSSLFARIEVIAALFLREILAVRPDGPYHLIGACMGGVIALEMAQQLLRQGKQVGLLAFLDTFPPDGVDPLTHLVYCLRLPLTVPWFVMQRARGHVGRLWRLASDFSAGSVVAEVRRLRGALDPGAVKDALTGNELYDLRVYAANHLAFQRYVPQAFPGRIHLISATKRDLQGHDDTRERWRHLAREGVETCPVVAHDSGGLMRAPAVYDVAETLRLWLGRVERGD